jgi:tRNA G18 (ribose-2'-O)-methylase SpoU
MIKKKRKFKSSLVLICDNIRSLQNVGSFFRTSDAFAIDKIYLCGYTGAPPAKEISKTALGAEEWVSWEKHSHAWRLIDVLKREGYTIVALEKTAHSTDIHTYKPQFPMALIVGNEVKGVSRSLLRKADRIIHISMYGKKESLNVSVAFGVAAAKITEYRK